ncbi:MAG TPA: hypothetical protein VF002_04975 [Gaiellaceae bacterium]
MLDLSKSERGRAAEAWRDSSKFARSHLWIGALTAVVVFGVWVVLPQSRSATVRLLFGAFWRTLLSLAIVVALVWLYHFVLLHFRSSRWELWWSSKDGQILFELRSKIGAQSTPPLRWQIKTPAGERFTHEGRLPTSQVGEVWVRYPADFDRAPVPESGRYRVVCAERTKRGKWHEFFWETAEVRV